MEVENDNFRKPGFFEGIWTLKEEALEYFDNHLEKQSCRLIYLPYDEFPMYVLEIGRGNFKKLIL